MGGWEEEVFYSLYQGGALSARCGHHDQAVSALFDAWSHSPHRAEPLYALAWMFRERNQHAVAHLVTAQGIRVALPRNALFVERWIYDWGLLFEYSIATYWVREYRAALDACNRLLRNARLPPAYRSQTERNRVWCLAAFAGSNRGTLTHGRLSGPVSRS